MISGRSATIPVRVALLALSVSAAAAAYVLVGGLSASLYAAGIVMAGVFAVAWLSGGAQVCADAPADRGRRWRRKSQVIAELEQTLANRDTELDERRRELAALGARLEAKMRTAAETEQLLGARIEQLERARENALASLASERMRFQLSLDTLSGDIGQRRSDLAALEDELAAMIGA